MSKEIFAGYCHITPGRLRVRVSNLKNRQEAAKSLEVLMVSQPGIKHARANPVTGNVLIRFDSKLASCESVLESLADLGHLPILDQKESAPQYDSALCDLGMCIGKNLVKVALKQALGTTSAAILLELI